MSHRLSDYDFELPDSLIAEYPPERRDQSRMLVLHRATGEIEHRRFVDILNYVQPGDLFVMNDARVIPARVFSDDRKIELLLLERLSAGRWTSMVKPGRKMRVGHRLVVGGVQGEVLEVMEDGSRVLQFETDLDLDRVGALPLPPYIRHKADAVDAERYQTVYAKASGAVAAPTAGLHFTPEILAKVPHAFLTLLVGAGTFKPVQCDDVREHIMHRENFMLSGETADSIRSSSRVIAVGTTVVRVLESVMTTRNAMTEAEGSTEIFIYPPYEFRAVDVLLTNFHLPKSTLLMLVSAFAGREQVLHAYAEAVREQYRFFSYGDCMLIV